MNTKHLRVSANYRRVFEICTAILLGCVLMILSQEIFRQTYYNRQIATDPNSYTAELQPLGDPTSLISKINSILRHELVNPLCPKRAIVLSDSGRSGNLFFEYTMARVVATLHQRKLYVSQRLADLLDVSFTGRRASVLEDNLHMYCQFNVKSLHSLEIGHLNQETIAEPLPPGIAILKGVPMNFSSFLWRLLYYSRSVLMQELQLKPRLVSAASQHLKQETQNHRFSTLIGIHVRRTDYLKHLQQLYGKTKDTEAEYVHKAKAFYKVKYPNALFLILSDDLPWCVENLKADDVIFPGAGNVYDPGWDLAILASCNHTILTYGTFGMLGAYLSGGEVVMADKATDTPNLINEAIRELNLPFWHWIDM